MNTTIRSYLWTICWHQTVHFLEIIAATWENFLELKAKVIKEHPYRICGRSAGRVFDDGIDEKKIFAENCQCPKA